MSVQTSLRDHRYVHRAAIAIVLLVLWELVAQAYPVYVLPGVVETIGATSQAVFNPRFGTYPAYIFDTFRRLFAGFVISVLLGSLLGTLMGLSQSAESFLRSWVVLGLSLPAIAAAFGLIIIIGISEWVPILTVVLVGVPFVMLNMWEGTQDLDPDISEMADFYGVSRFQRYRDILLPQLLQYLFPSMYWGFIVSWKVLFIAEVFGSGSGVGYMVNYWFTQQRVDMLVGWVVIPVIIVIGLQEVLRYTEHKVMAWR